MELLRDPTQDISNFRLLGGWWAGQLLDSALIRGRSSLDRLMTLLQYVHVVKVRDRLPGFEPQEFDKLISWADDADLNALRNLFSNPIFEYGKSMRDGLIHRQRQPSALHGDHVANVEISANAPDGRALGMTPSMHLQITLAYYNEVLVTACALAGNLIARYTKPSPAAAARSAE